MLLRRITNPELGLDGFWQGVTGGLEEGEDIISAARRELFEETGFVSSSIEKTEYSYSFPKDNRWNTMYSKEVHEIVEHVLFAFVEGSTEPVLSHEHDEYVWCSLDQAMGKLKYAQNIEGLKRCAQQIIESMGVST